MRATDDADILEIQTNYTKLQNELQALAQKIGELESEAEEHE
jgi:prefoldin subunit 2